MGIGDFFRNLADPVEGTRDAMRKSYQKHQREIVGGRLPLPPGTSRHQAALYGALSSRYRSAGTSLEAVERMEPFIWLELVPFAYLDQDEGLEALAEYVVWKESGQFGTSSHVRIEWLKSRVREGVASAEKAGHSEMVRQAMRIEAPDGSTAQSPWGDLL